MAAQARPKAPSGRRPSARPVPIADFCEEVLKIYKPTPTKRDYTTYYRVRRIVKFLTQHPSVKTTADLATPLIPEFITTCDDISESTKITILMHFRRICNLAVERGCLKRNPFESHALPSSPSRSFATTPKGRELSTGQIRSILEYLKSRAGTWKGHRLYAFAATVVYAGLQPSEALELKCADCDLARGVIRVSRRSKFQWSMYPPEVQIPPALAGILAAWLPRRKKGKPAWAAQVRYGTKLADDGYTLIADEAEQRALADMLRWKAEGWALKRIARELDARGVPTKNGGAKWSHGSVDVILKRESQANAGNSTARDGDSVEDTPRPDPVWVFPNVSGKGHWQRTDSPGYAALDQIRAAGKALGIDGLTTESLRRFYLEHKRTSLDLGRDGQGGEPSETLDDRVDIDRANSTAILGATAPVSRAEGQGGAAIAPAKGREAGRPQAPSVRVDIAPASANDVADIGRPATPAAPARVPRVVKLDDGAYLVYGVRRTLRTKRQRKLVDFLMSGGDQGRSTPELRNVSAGYHGVLCRIRSDPAWERGILPPDSPGKKGDHWRIAHGDSGYNV